MQFAHSRQPTQRLHGVWASAWQPAALLVSQQEQATRQVVSHMRAIPAAAAALACLYLLAFISVSRSYASAATARAARSSSPGLSCTPTAIKMGQ